MAAKVPSQRAISVRELQEREKTKLKKPSVSSRLTTRPSKATTSSVSGDAKKFSEPKAGVKSSSVEVEQNQTLQEKQAKEKEKAHEMAEKRRTDKKKQELSSGSPKIAVRDKPSAKAKAPTAKLGGPAKTSLRASSGSKIGIKSGGTKSSVPGTKTAPIAKSVANGQPKVKAEPTPATATATIGNGEAVVSTAGDHPAGSKESTDGAQGTTVSIETKGPSEASEKSAKAGVPQPTKKVRAPLSAAAKTTAKTASTATSKAATRPTSKASTSTSARTAAGTKSKAALSSKSESCLPSSKSQSSSVKPVSKATTRPATAVPATKTASSNAGADPGTKKPSTRGASGTAGAVRGGLGVAPVSKRATGSPKPSRIASGVGKVSSPTVKATDSKKSPPRVSKPGPMKATPSSPKTASKTTPAKATPGKTGLATKTPTTSGRIPTASGKTATASVKTPTASGKTPTVSGKTLNASVKTPTALGRTPTASGKTPTASGKTPATKAGTGIPQKKLTVAKSPAGKSLNASSRGKEPDKGITKPNLGKKAEKPVSGEEENNVPQASVGLLSTEGSDLQSSSAPDAFTPSTAERVGQIISSQTSLRKELQSKLPRAGESIGVGETESRTGDQAEAEKEEGVAESSVSSLGTSIGSESLARAVAIQLQDLPEDFSKEWKESRDEEQRREEAEREERRKKVDEIMDRTRAEALQMDLEDQQSKGVAPLDANVATSDPGLAESSNPMLESQAHGPAPAAVLEEDTTPQTVVTKYSPTPSPTMPIFPGDSNVDGGMVSSEPPVEHGTISAQDSFVFASTYEPAAADMDPGTEAVASVDIVIGDDISESAVDTSTDHEDVPVTEPEAVPSMEHEDVPVTEPEAVPSMEHEDVPVTELEVVPSMEHEDVPVTESEVVPSMQHEDVPTTEPEAIPSMEHMDVPVTEPEVVPSMDYEDVPTTEPEAILSMEHEDVSTTEPEAVPSMPVTEQEAVPSMEHEDVPVTESEAVPSMEDAPVTEAEAIPSMEHENVPTTEPEAVPVIEPEAVPSTEYNFSVTEPETMPRTEYEDASTAPETDTVQEDVLGNVEKQDKEDEDVVTFEGEEAASGVLSMLPEDTGMELREMLDDTARRIQVLEEQKIVIEESGAASSPEPEPADEDPLDVAPTTELLPSPEPPLVESVLSSPEPPLEGSSPLLRKPVGSAPSSPELPLEEPVSSSPEPPLGEPALSSPEPPLGEPALSSPPLGEPILSSPEPPLGEPVLSSPEPPLGEQVLSLPEPPLGEQVLSSPEPPLGESSPEPPLEKPVLSSPKPFLDEPSFSPVPALEEPAGPLPSEVASADLSSLEGSAMAPPPSSDVPTGDLFSFDQPTEDAPPPPPSSDVPTDMFSFDAPLEAPEDVPPPPPSSEVPTGDLFSLDGPMEPPEDAPPPPPSSDVPTGDLFSLNEPAELGTPQEAPPSPPEIPPSYLEASEGALSSDILTGDLLAFDGSTEASKEFPPSLPASQVPIADLFSLEASPLESGAPIEPLSTYDVSSQPRSSILTEQPFAPDVQEEELMIPSGPGMEEEELKEDIEGI